MRRRTARADGGFALIEALSALAIASLVVLTMAIAAGLLLRSWERAAAQAQSLESLSSGLEALRKDLSAATRARWGDDGDGGVLFRGTADAIVLATAREPTGPGPGNSLVSVRARHERGAAVLVRASAPLLPNTRLSARFGNPVELMSGPWHFRFSYKAGDDGEEAEYHEAGRRGEWQDSWSEDDELPAAIRLAVIDPATDRAIVPPLVVTPRIDAEPGCVEGSDGFCSFARESDEDEEDEEEAEEADMDGIGDDGDERESGADRGSQ